MSAASHSAYLFEAKGIQRWIFAAGKLRDIIGASDLLAGLARSDGQDAIGHVLEALGLAVGEAVGPGRVTFSRRAGGAFCLHGERAALERVRAQWRLFVMTGLPGLGFVDAIGEAAEGPLAAMRAAYAAAGRRENEAATVLPLGRSVHLYAPLTGRPATASFRYRNRFGEDDVLADAVTEPQRKHGESLQSADALDGVAQRMLGAAMAPPGNRRWAFPRNLDWRDGDTRDNPLFPFRRAAGEPAEAERVDREPADQRIAVIHADVSGLGQAFRALGAGITEPRQMLALAARIEGAIARAVQQAAHEVLLPAAADRHGDLRLIPARPVIIGGDDISVIVRADLAIPFAVRLLEGIEEETRKAEIGRGLSAAAGMAIAGKGLPYLTAYALAESLCDFAKTDAKAKAPADGTPFPSALAFHHQTQTAHESWDDILPGLADAAGARLLSANPYALDARAAEAMGAPRIGALHDLARAIAELPGAAGAIREMRDDWIASPGTARARWQRFRDVAARRNPEGLGRIDAALGALGITDREALPEHAPRPVDGVGKAVATTPLFDALVLVDVAMPADAAAGADAPAAIGEAA